MRCYKKLFVAAVSFLVLTAVVLTPSFYFALQESFLLEGRYERHIVPVAIDPQAEEIYLVRAVRGAYYLGVGLPEAKEQNLRDEWSALAAHVPGVPLLPDAPLQGSIDISRRASDGTSLQLHEFFWDKGASQAAVTVHNDSKTGKFLYLAVYPNADLIRASQDTQPSQKKEQIARAYCAYLGLDILGDWSAQDIGLVSKKAALKIVCHDTPDSFTLFIAPLESQWEPAPPFNLVSDN